MQYVNWRISCAIVFLIIGLSDSANHQVEMALKVKTQTKEE